MNNGDARFCVECGARLGPRSSEWPAIPNKGRPARRTLELTPQEPEQTNAAGSMTEALAAVVPEAAPPSAQPALASELAPVAMESPRAAEPAPMGIEPARSVEPAPLSAEPARAVEPAPLSAERPHAPTPPPAPVAPAPPSAEPARPPSDEHAPFSAILGDLDSSFEAMLTESSSTPSASHTELDLSEAQALFKQIAAEYAAPLRGLLIELRLGDASKDWIQICLPAITAMAQSADQMGLEQLAAAMGELRSALESAEWAPGTGISGDTRTRVLASADTLVAELPEAFAVEREADQREPVIVRSLLGQVPGVRKVQLDRIYRAGLVSLKMFFAANARELADTTGLEIDLADRIVSRFRRYRNEILAGPGDASRSNDLTSIGKLTWELQQLNQEYEGDKRRVRQRRADLMHEVNVLLARLGCVPLVDKLERLPFHKKAEELLHFVRDRMEQAS